MNPDFFASNRKKLVDEMHSGALVVITGHGEMQRLHDEAHRFEQEANFWYLCGIEEPDWWLVIDGSQGTEWLVAPSLSDTQRVFDGGLSEAGAKTISGIKTVIDRDEALRRLRQLTKHHSIAYTVGQPQQVREYATFQLNTSQSELRKTLERIFQKVNDCSKTLRRLRAIKTTDEIQQIERAVDLTIKSYDTVRALLSDAKHEYELEAQFGYDFRMAGSKGFAYRPIIASGKNACTLHYTNNNSQMRSGQLVLFDIGARLNGYAADISRTYAKGKPTKRQQEVHAAVEQALYEVIALIKPGVGFDEYHAKTDMIMQRVVEGLRLKGDFREYFPHAIGHGLGLDVHDSLDEHFEMKPGMVMTVEPGIYIPAEGIGVRIEDNILVTPNGTKNLSRKLSTKLV